MKILTAFTAGLLIGIASMFYYFVAQNIERGFMQAKAQGILEAMNETCPSFVKKYAESQAKK
jgi:formate/nitrite transporter FocA (FNT family)